MTREASSHVTVHEHYCVESGPEPCGVVIFGASGDLTQRKLIPALFRLYERELLPENFYILGCARTAMSDDAFRRKMRTSFATNDKMAAFLDHCFYLSGDYKEFSFYRELRSRLAKLTEAFRTGSNRVFYLATPPNLYTEITNHLSESQLTKEDDDGSWARVVIEKPFGRDLQSAVALNRELHKKLTESQIYRIDHYLGKETVQNILMLRFANAIFDPIWNRQYIDNVQITVAESIGVEHRAGYYEQSGLLRDMFQNHLMEILALVAMEPPASFAANCVRDEKTKLLRAIRPLVEDRRGDNLVRAQYEGGRIDGETVVAYRQEADVAADSMVETFVAANLVIDNWRWQGVPFYLRSGKRLPRKVSEVAITFKKVPHSIFTPLMPDVLPANVMLLNLQPDEGIGLTIQAKKPGPKLCMASLAMDFNYREIFGTDSMPDAYERLLLDCMLGDQTLFVREDSMQLAWSLLTPLLQRWEGSGNSPPLCFYAAGSWGPQEAIALLQRQGRNWYTQ